MGWLLHYYNIPSNNRELQPPIDMFIKFLNYNIPSNNRELQQTLQTYVFSGHYNIPSNNRELQQNCIYRYTHLIITYQVITGNYSIMAHEPYNKEL